MKIIKLSNDDKVLSLKQALYATEPLHKDAQEKYEASWNADRLYNQILELLND